MEPEERWERYLKQSGRSDLTPAQERRWKKKWHQAIARERARTGQPVHRKWRHVRRALRHRHQMRAQ